MKKAMIWIVAIMGILVVVLAMTPQGSFRLSAMVFYFQARFFPSERHQRMFKKLQDIFIYNDLSEDVCIDAIRDGERSVDWIEPLKFSITDQGNVRIFVPEKKGWYTITSPYPYPLTKQTSWFIVGSRIVKVNLSDLINSIQSGQVECTVGESMRILDATSMASGKSEKQIVKDIKVTFEPGEAPQKDD